MGEVNPVTITAKKKILPNDDLKSPETMRKKNLTWLNKLCKKRRLYFSLKKCLFFPPLLHQRV